MKYAVGLDIGGTKVAGAAFDEAGKELARISLPIPDRYDSLLETCASIVKRLELTPSSVGVCAPFSEGVCANIPYLAGKDLRKDLENLFHLPIPLENDANCAALAEALEGAGKGYRSVVGLIMGTGVGAGFVLDGRIVAGANGMCGEIGHLPLPAYCDGDGAWGACGCGKRGCIEYFISGEGLSRIYTALTGKKADGRQIAALALDGEQAAIGALDGYYELVAKAMTVILHTFDPEVIAVSGGLSCLPGLFEEVPKRWGKYAICKEPKTRFVRAALGPVAGVRGAAYLGKSAV
ncbi:MAG: ROK family protein [Alphaproteobacteria bacterium]|nr:ROK family protein [Alphaproteobacteria bacterium]